jgi:hypothetical protein
VGHDRGVYYEEDASIAIKPAQPVMTVGGAVPLTDSLWNSANFIAPGYALGSKLPRGVIGNADWDIKTRTVKRIVEGLRLLREIRVAKLLTTTGSFAAANQITPAAKWNGAGATPLADLFNGLAASYLPANVLILPEILAPGFYVQGSTVRDYVQAGGPLPRVVVARAKKMVAGAPQYVWAPATPSNVTLVRSTPDDPDKLMTSRTYRWVGSAGDGEQVDGMLVRVFEVPEEDSTYVVVSHSDKEVIVDNRVGATIVSAYA